jgi:hypothetical protein
MVKVHGQGEPLKKKLEKEERTEQKEDLQKDKKNIALEKYLKDMHSVRNIMYDSIVKSESIEGLGVPGDIFETIIDNLTNDIFIGLFEAGYAIFDTEIMKNIEKDLKFFKERVQNPDIVINTELDKRCNYLLTVLNDINRLLPDRDEGDWNCFSEFNYPDKAIKMKEEEPLIVYGFNGQKIGLSNFSLISTITNILVNRKLIPVIDEDEFLIHGYTWQKNKKSTDLESRLDELVGDFSDRKYSQDEVFEIMDIAKESIRSLKEFE